MFRRKQRGQLHARVPHRVDVPPPALVEASMIRDQPDPFTLQRRELVLLHHIEPGQHPMIRSDHPPHARPGHRFVKPDDADTGRIHPDGCGGNGRHAGPQRRETLPRLRMHEIRQQNDVRIRRWIDPHRRPRKSRVSIGTDGKQLPAIRRIGGIDIPAQGAQYRLILRRLGRSKLSDGEWRKDAHAVARPHPQHHLRETRQIRGRREQPSVSRDASHQPRSRIVHHTAKRLSRRRIDLCRRNPSAQ